MSTISIKLGKTIHTFNIEKTIAGIIITKQDNHGIILELNQIRNSWCVTGRVREIEFFEDDLVEIAVKYIKKNKL